MSHRFILKLVALICLSITAWACNARSATNNGVGSDQRGTSTSQTVVSLGLFEPRPDDELAGLWAELTSSRSPATVRSKIAERYRVLGFHSMARLFEQAGRAETGQEVDLIRPSRSDWACSDFDDDSVYAAVAEIDQELAKFDFGTARKIAAERIQSLGPACPLLVEGSLAILAVAASTSSDVSPAEVELAVRTLVTADLEMGLAPYQGGSSWPYQLLIEYFSNRGDYAAAYVAARIAKQRLEAQPHSPRASMIQVDAALDTLRKKLGIR